MKIKQHLVITDPIKFAKGDYNCFNLFGYGPVFPDDWVSCGEIEIEVNVDVSEVTGIAVAEIERKQEELRASTTAAMTELTRMKNELLAITYQEE